jgi:hypothetical protein
MPRKAGPDSPSGCPKRTKGVSGGSTLVLPKPNIVLIVRRSGPGRVGRSTRTKVRVTMTTSAKVRLAVGVALGVALLALAGCTRFGGGAVSDGTQTTDLTWDQQALQSIGFSADDVSTGQPIADAPQVAASGAPTAAPSAGGRLAKLRARHRLLRFAFGGKTLHGEAVVQTDDGTKTVVVQRGTVTAVDATSMTVKSTDGFSLTWTFGNPVHVIQNKAQATTSALAVGTTVGVAGARSGSTTTASLVVVPPKK